MLDKSGKKGFMPKMVGKMVFKALDKNGDGQLDNKELAGLLNLKGKKQEKQSQTNRYQAGYANDQAQIPPNYNHPGSSQHTTNPTPNSYTNPYSNSSNYSHVPQNMGFPDNHAPGYGAIPMPNSNQPYYPGPGHNSGIPMPNSNQSYYQGPIHNSGIPMHNSNQPYYQGPGHNSGIPMPNGNHQSYYPGPGQNSGMPLPGGYDQYGHQNNSYPGSDGAYYNQPQSSGYAPNNYY